MILTVTLNAAIDRTIAVPNFRQGRRHRAVERRTDGRRQGRQRRPRAEAARPAGDRHRPRRRPDRRAADRAARRGVDPHRLHPDRRRVADQPRRRRPDLRRADRDQRARPRRHPEELERFLEKLIYLARGARICVIAGSLPPSVPPDFCARIVTALKEIGVEAIVDTDGEPLHASLRAGPAVVTPNVAEAEEAVGHEFNDREDLLAGVRGLVELGAGEAIITSPNGCVARRRRRRAAPRPTRSPLPSSSRSRRSAPATPSSPATSPPATRAPRRATASPTASPAAPSRPSTSAPARSTARRSSTWSSRSRSPTSRPAPRSVRPAAAPRDPAGPRAGSRAAKTGRALQAPLGGDCRLDRALSAQAIARCEADPVRQFETRRG